MSERRFNGRTWQEWREEANKRYELGMGCGADLVLTLLDEVERLEDKCTMPDQTTVDEHCRLAAEVERLRGDLDDDTECYIEGVERERHLAGIAQEKAESENAALRTERDTWKKDHGYEVKWHEETRAKLAAAEEVIGEAREACNEPLYTHEPEVKGAYWAWNIKLRKIVDVLDKHKEDLK
jgi:hypothetical protein